MLSAEILCYVAFLPLNYLGHMGWPWVILKNTSFGSVYVLDVCLYKHPVWNSLAMCTPSAGAQTTYMQVSLFTNLPIASDRSCNRDLLPAASVPGSQGASCDKVQGISAAPEAGTEGKVGKNSCFTFVP